MRKVLFIALLLPVLAVAQFSVSGGGSLDLDEMLPIIADSAKWTDGSTVNAIKPRDAKTVEADSGKFGALEVTGNTTLDGNLTMVTTAAESLVIAAGGIRNEGGLINKGPAYFGATATRATIATTGKITTVDSVVTTLGIRSQAGAWFKGNVGINTTPSYPLHVYKASPGANDVLLRIGTSDDADRVSIDEDGDITADGTIKATAGFEGLVIGAAFYDAASTFYVSTSNGQSLGGGSSEVILGGRYYNPADSDYETFATTGLGGKSYIMGWGTDRIFTTMPDSVKMALTATGNLGLGTTTPGAKMEIAGSKSADTLLSVYNDVTGLTARDSTFAVLSNGNVANNKMVTIKRTVSLADQAEYTPQIPAGMCGWGKVMIGDFVEWARFHFKADGTVTLETNSTNVGTTNDVDAKLNIYDGGTGGVIIENQLGSTLTAAMVIECYTP